jgi:capsular exopolysaccharide synthesis family protein
MTSSAAGKPGQLVTLSDPRSAAAEAYRTLRTNLQFTMLDRPSRALLVTSPLAGEGKSTTLANLAVVSAEAGMRVVVLDADLRRPRIHELFGVSQSPGFSSLALGVESGDMPLQDTAVAGLRVLTSGILPPNPSELLASPRTAAILESLRELADLVLIDSAPVLPVSDAAVLAARCDGVLLVVRYGKTPRDAARRAREQLDKVGARILGVTINGARLDRSYGDYYRAQ